MATYGCLICVIDREAASNLTPSISLIKLLKNLYFSLVKGLFLIRILVLKLLDSHSPASPIALGFINMTKAALANNIKQVIIAIKHTDGPKIFLPKHDTLLAVRHSTNGAKSAHQTAHIGSTLRRAPSIRPSLGLHRTPGPLNPAIPAAGAPVVVVVVGSAAGAEVAGDVGLGWLGHGRGWLGLVGGQAVEGGGRQG